MSYEVVKSINAQDPDNIKITSASSNVSPRTYQSWDFKGSLEELYQYLLGGMLQIQASNRQKINDAYLSAKLHLVKNKVDTYELYINKYQPSSKYYDTYMESYNIFQRVLNQPQSKKKYYVTINGNSLVNLKNTHSTYSPYLQKPQPLRIALLAQLRYGLDKVTIQPAKE